MKTSKQPLYPFISNPTNQKHQIMENFGVQPLYMVNMLDLQGN